MKKKLILLAVASAIAALIIQSCNMGTGDLRDRNIRRTLNAYLDSVPEFEYIGMSDTHDLDDDRFQAVVMLYVTDSAGNRVERDVRVTTNHDCTEIYLWEDLESTVVEDAKMKVSEKMQEKGIDLDGSIIDTLLKLKNR